MNKGFNTSNVYSNKVLNSEYTGEAFTLAYKKKIKKSKEEVDQTLFKIVIENIIHGIDKRTTVMIRHIPNKYGTQTLMEELNTVCKGKYDFFYLPMDYEVIKF